MRLVLHLFNHFIRLQVSAIFYKKQDRGLQFTWGIVFCALIVGGPPIKADECDTLVDKSPVSVATKPSTPVSEVLQHFFAERFMGRKTTSFAGKLTNPAATLVDPPAFYGAIIINPRDVSVLKDDATAVAQLTRDLLVATGHKPSGTLDKKGVLKAGGLGGVPQTIPVSVRGFGSSKPGDLNLSFDYSPAQGPLIISSMKLNTVSDQLGIHLLSASLPAKAKDPVVLIITDSMKTSAGRNNPGTITAIPLADLVQSIRSNADQSDPLVKQVVDQLAQIEGQKEWSSLKQQQEMLRLFFGIHKSADVAADPSVATVDIYPSLPEKAVASYEEFMLAYFDTDMAESKRSIGDFKEFGDPQQVTDYLSKITKENKKLFVVKRSKNQLGSFAMKLVLNALILGPVAGISVYYLNKLFADDLDLYLTPEGEMLDEETIKGCKNTQFVGERASSNSKIKIFIVTGCNGEQREKKPGAKRVALKLDDESVEFTVRYESTSVGRVLILIPEDQDNAAWEENRDVTLVTNSGTSLTYQVNKDPGGIIYLLPHQ